MMPPLPLLADKYDLRLIDVQASLAERVCQLVHGQASREALGTSPQKNDICDEARPA
jgi:hypothetical protein